MRLLRPVEYPANRPARRWVFDVLVTVLAAALSLPNLYQGGARHWPGVAAFVVLALMVAPLVVRRIWPIPVFGWILVTQIAAVSWDSHLIAGAALLIALYTVARLQSRRDALACGGVLELTVVTALPLLAGAGWWHDLIFLSGLIAAALGLGLYTGTRRAYLAELRDRADRLERERDQQAALAVAAERTRIAREMHNIVAHHLTVMITLSEAAIAASASSPERANDVMRSVADTGRRALADTRRLLGVLRQRPSQDPGQDPARTRVPAARPRPHSARHAHRTGPIRGTGHHAGDPRPGPRRAGRGAADGLPARAGGPHQHSQARRTRRPRLGAPALPPRRTAGRHRRRRRGCHCPRDRGHRQRPARHAGTGPRLRRRRAGRPRPPGGWQVSARLRLDGGDAG